MACPDFHSEIRNFLFNDNPVPMFLYDGCTLRILQANEIALEQYGYSQSEFRAMTIRDLRPHGDAPALETVLLLDSEVPSQSIWTHADKAGKNFAVEVKIVPFNRGHRKLWLMSAVDASAWSDTRLKLVHSEEMHRSLVEQCPFGIYRLNLVTDRFEQANPALLEGLGYTRDELCSIAIRDFYYDPSDRDQFLSKLRSAGIVQNFETRFRKKDGNIIRVSLSGYLCSNNDTGQQYIQGYVLDVTRQRELEEQLSHSHRMEAVGRLAGGIAHDFNNITQSISLSCEIAMQDKLPQTTESKLLDVMQQTARAVEITQQLLAFSSRQVLQPRVVNVNDCIRKALPMLTRSVGMEVSIRLKLDENIDDIFIDPEQLALVLMQLAHNARTAMPHGGVLRLSTASLPCPRNLNHCTVLTVSDTGIGMDDTTRQHIFEPFFSTKDTTLTTGLGLSTVHGIIAQSKGRIECDSSPGNGATFRIFLPIAPSQTTVSVDSIRNSHRSRILLAEDDPIVNRHLAHALKKAGFLVHSVCNGEHALAAFDHRSYDLLVTDIMMPKIGGVELTKRLRHQFPSLPVVLISGYTDETSVLQHLPHEQLAYLQKPFHVSQLISSILGLLSARDGAQTLGKERITKQSF